LRWPFVWLHGAHTRGAAVVPVWCACPLHDAGLPLARRPLGTGREGLVVVDLRAAGGVVACAASSMRRGKTVTFLTTFGWFVAALGVVSSHLG
jgi:hypothetical protein